MARPRIFAGWLLAACLVCGQAAASEFFADLALHGQVRDGDQSREREVPVDVYGNLGAAGLRHGASAETYFRFGRDLGLEESSGDFYAGALRVPGAIRGVDFSLGRQFLSPAPGAAFVADAGKVRIDDGWPVAFTLFGGQPRYFEPTFPPDRLSQDEQIFGGSVQTTRWWGGQASLGYLQQDRDDHVLRQLITGNWGRAFTRWPGMPKAYGSMAYDADRQNIDQGTAGVDVFLSQPRLLLNAEGSYYKPQDQGEYLQREIDRREDAIFELFSLSELVQVRGGLRYHVSRDLSAYADYSYQRYEKLKGEFENGHVASAGLMWLPGGDGLEVVRLEYYVIDSGGGNVNGGKASYESRVYERLVFGAKVDVAYYEKESNERDAAVSSRLGVGYVVLPGLVWELAFEANHNQRFDEDFRFGLAVTYNFSHRLQSTRPRQERS